MASEQQAHYDGGVASTSSSVERVVACRAMLETGGSHIMPSLSLVVKRYGVCDEPVGLKGDAVTTTLLGGDI